MGANPSALVRESAGAAQSAAVSPRDTVGIQVGGAPVFATFDATNGYVYVPNYDSDDVSIISGSTVIATVGVGSLPVSATYDGGNGFVYISNSNSSNVSIINGTTVVGSVNVPEYPESGVYDPRDGDVYISDRGSFYVSVLDGPSLVANLYLCGGPGQAAFDSENGFVYVPCGQTIVILNGTQQIGSVGSADAVFALYDPSDDYVYVSDLGNNTVHVIDGTRLISTLLPGQSPWFEAYDSRNGFVYILNYGYIGPGNVTVLSGTAIVGSVTLTSADTENSPSAAVYDIANGNVYVTNSGSGNVSVISGTRLVDSITVGTGPNHPAYDDQNGCVYVPDEESNEVSDIFTEPAYEVNFTESGLPTGTAWSVVVNGSSQLSDSGTIQFNEPDGSYSYTVVRPNAYLPTPSSGTLDVDGVGQNVSIVFTPLPTYAVTFTESGLTPGTNWSVQMVGVLEHSTTPTIQFSVSNGSYTYVLGPLDGWVTVTYAGAIVVDGEPVSETINWTAVTFPVSFSELGLPPGTGWWVNISAGPSTFSGTTALSVELPSGNYSYSSSATDPEYRSPGGSFSVEREPATETVQFSKRTSTGLYSVTFAEIGLESGVLWSVLFDGVEQSGRSAIVFASTPNGTYSFTVGAAAGYDATPDNGSIQVNGGPERQVVTFAPSPGPHGPGNGTEGFLGLRAGYDYLLVGAACVAVGMAIGLARHLRKRVPPEPTPSPSERE
jgi:YVTN family beta-propeller protein